MLAAASFLLAGVMIDNGDFWRVARGAGIHPLPWQPLADRYPLPASPTALGPSTTLEALVGALAVAHRWAGSAHFHLASLRALLVAIFVAGLFRLLRDTTGRERLRACALTLTLFTLYAFYLKSLYEEAVVLAALPWLLAGIARLQGDGRVRTFALASAAVLAAKAQMVFALPVLLFVVADAAGRRAVSPAIAIVAGATLVAAAALPLATMHGPGEMRPFQTAYNRFFNGLGWSAQHVASWPARNFTERHRHFEANQPELQARSLAFEPFPGHTFLGTSYWPTGDAMHAAEQRGETPSPPWAALVAQGRIPSYARHLAQHPVLFADHLFATYAVTLGSDYRLDYVRTHPPEAPGWTRRLSAPVAWTLQGLGAAFLALGAWLVLRAGTAGRKAVAAYWFLGAPLFTVLGDGYHELERHLTPYFMLVPAIVMIVLPPPPASRIGPRRRPRDTESAQTRN